MPKFDENKLTCRKLEACPLYAVTHRPSGCVDCECCAYSRKKGRDCGLIRATTEQLMAARKAIGKEGRK